METDFVKDENVTDYDVITTSFSTSVPVTHQVGNYDHLKYLIFAFGIITFICGIVGNSLVIYIIAKFSEIRNKSVANYYIFNLALADQLFLLAVPFFMYSSFMEKWIFGNSVCKLMFIMREINKFGSIFTLVALSVDRYLASFHNLGHLRTLPVGICVCVVVWIASIAMCSPYIMYSNTVKRSSMDTYSCKINWPQDGQVITHRKIWTYSQLAVGMIIPFILITVSYILLLRRLRSIMKPRQSTRIRKPNRKMTRTVLVVVAIFVVCQMPYHAMEILNLQKTEEIMNGKKPDVHGADFMAFLYVNAVSQILVFISACCNPILYGILNENYRKLYKMVLCGCCWRNGSRTLMTSVLRGTSRRSDATDRPRHQTDALLTQEVINDGSGAPDVVLHTTSQCKRSTGRRVSDMRENSSFV